MGEGATGRVFEGWFHGRLCAIKRMDEGVSWDTYPLPPPYNPPNNLPTQPSYAIEDAQTLGETSSKWRGFVWTGDQMALRELDVFTQTDALRHPNLVHFCTKTPTTSLCWPPSSFQRAFELIVCVCKCLDGQSVSLSNTLWSTWPWRSVTAHSRLKVSSKVLPVDSSRPH